MAIDKDDMTELRGDMPRAVVDLLDAVSTARRMSRMALVRKILHDWALKTYHEAQVIDRVTKGNPPLAAIDWQETET